MHQAYKVKKAFKSANLTEIRELERYLYNNTPSKTFLLLLQKLKLTPHSPPVRLSFVQMYCIGVDFGYIWLFREILHLELTTEGSGVRFTCYLEKQNEVMFSETS